MISGNVVGPELIILVLLAAVALAIYFVPSIVALTRHHHQVGTIIVINLLLGWTFVGWVVALAMSLSAINRQPPVGYWQQPGPPQY